MAIRGACSNSVLREINLATAIAPSLQWDFLNKLLEKDKNGRNITARQQVITALDVFHIDRHLVFNASKLKYKKLHEYLYN